MNNISNKLYTKKKRKLKDMWKRKNVKIFLYVDIAITRYEFPNTFEFSNTVPAFAVCSVTAWKRVFLSGYRLDHLGGCAAGSVWYWPAHQKISKPLCFTIGEGRSLPKLSRKLPRSLTLIHLPSFYPIASCSHILPLTLIRLFVSHIDVKYLFLFLPLYFLLQLSFYDCTVNGF